MATTIAADVRGTVLILVAEDYEDLEVWYPKLRLEEAGYAVKLAGLGAARYSGKHGYPCTVDGDVGDFPAGTLVGLLAPGGWAPDKLRRDAAVLGLVREMHESGKMIATICHGPWILVSAGILHGRTLTSSVGIKDDVTNAGAVWVDRTVAVDGNIISSRKPADLPEFGVAMVDFLAGLEAAN